MKTMEREIKAKALSLGFSACGIASATHLVSEQHRFENAMEQNFHAGMRYLERNIDRRFDPRRYFPDCRSVIVALFHYPVPSLDDDFYKVARYAHLPDYHLFMKEMLEELAAPFHHAGTAYKTTVDTSPVTEKNWAVKAGLGSIGKNTLFRSEKGSFCLIGTILTTLSLNPDPEKEIPCENCNRCVKACPTGALKPYQLDCTKCIAYLTIEHKGEISETTAHQPWIFGCDICQEACPHNKTALENGDRSAKFSLFSHLEKEGWENLNKEQFQLLFKDTPLERRTFERVMEQIKNKNYNV